MPDLSTNKVSFAGSPQTGSAPLTVVFTDTSTGSSRHNAWDFGDGSPILYTAGSAGEAVTHTYTSAGSYTVSLSSVFSSGSPATGEQINYNFVTVEGGTVMTGPISLASSTNPVLSADAGGSIDLSLSVVDWRASGGIQGGTANWVARESARNWFAAASSADGTKLVAVVYGGRLYVSEDSGSSWMPRESDRNWYSAASSADGTKLVAIVYGGQIYTSTDSGITWTPREGNRNWSWVASSADGIKLVATVDGGQIYTSTDSGITWTPRESARSWYSVASSSNGIKLVAVVFGGQIYTSTDSGATWIPRESVRDWYSVTSSADGSKLLAAEYGGQLYTSIDSGATWTARENNRLWYSVTSSEDGTKLAATGGGMQIYVSTDSGITWMAQDSIREWYGIASSASGDKLIAVANAGNIYTYSNVIIVGNSTFDVFVDGSKVANVAATNGSATFKGLVFKKTGTISLSAKYTGDANNLPSETTSPLFQQVIPTRIPGDDSSGAGGVSLYSQSVATVVTHAQTTPSDTWTIVHNIPGLPVIDVYVDVGGTKQKILADSVAYVDQNTCVVGFTTPISGIAAITASGVLPVTVSPAPGLVATNYVAPKLKAIVFRGNLNNAQEPSYFDIAVLESSKFNTALPEAESQATVYDGFCIDLLTPIGAPGVYNCAIYSPYELEIMQSSSLMQSPVVSQAIANIDNISYLLSYYAGSGATAGFTAGDVQVAIWMLAGNTVPAGFQSSFLGAYDLARATLLYNLALSDGNGYKPAVGQSMGVIITPFREDGTRQQPIVFEAQAAGISGSIFSNMPASGVTIKLVRPGVVGALHTTTTDLSGNYSFIGLTPDLEYQVEFSPPPGFRSSATSLSTVFRLAPGEARTNVNKSFF